MSNYLSIATVTAVLQKTLQEGLQNDVYGARVTTVRPLNLGGNPSDSGVNIFLYQVANNHAFKNIDVATMRARGESPKRQTALDLYYMLSFYGNDAELEPQRILGSVVRILNDRRVLNSDLIRETLESSSFPFLRESNLADQIQQINISPFDISLDDLSKVWSTFLQSPYILSIVYKVVVVLIEGKEPFKRPLPIRGRNLGGIAPFPNKPQINRIVAQSDWNDPILANSIILIQGKNLDNNQTRIRISNRELITPDNVRENEIILSLANIPINSLKAGVQSLQVIHQIDSGIINAGLASVESNVYPFVLCPTIKNITTDEVERLNIELRSATILIQTDLAIQPKQKIILALNEWSNPLSDNPKAYLFEAPIIRRLTQRITIPIEKIKAGEYLVRLMVDGAESQLIIDNNPESSTQGWFIGPKLIID
jgi:hypothetical protein